MVTVRAVVVGDSRRAPAFELLLACMPVTGQLLELPPRGGVVEVLYVMENGDGDACTVLCAPRGR